MLVDAIHVTMVTPEISWESTMGEDFAHGLKSWAWLPKFCRIFGSQVFDFPTGFLLRDTFHRTTLQQPPGSAEFRGGGEPGPSFEDRLLFLPNSGPVVHYKHQRPE